MDIFSILLIVVGLAAFETIASIDNAIINADILSTMKEWARRWFLVWGILIAVFVVRGILPWLIIWLSTPSVIGPVEAFTVAFSGDQAAADAIALSAPYLLLAGGVFFILLLMHWLFVEEKECIVPGERACCRLHPWFNALAAVFLCILIYFAVKADPLLGAAAAAGSAVYFIMQGIRIYADVKTHELGTATESDRKSDISKLLLLEVIDATFSIDGVVGAFAFTFSVPLILIGNGLGAIIVREITVKYVDVIKNYAYLKNGAMYSIGCLGIIMCSEGLGVEVPTFLPPVLTIIIVSTFFYLSCRKLKRDSADPENI